jgi:hypothetical protein
MITEQKKTPEKSGVFVLLATGNRQLARAWN